VLLVLAAGNASVLIAHFDQLKASRLYLKKYKTAKHQDEIYDNPKLQENVPPRPPPRPQRRGPLSTQVGRRVAD
jgi:hypothetical protein